MNESGALTHSLLVNEQKKGYVSGSKFAGDPITEFVSSFLVPR